MAQPGSVSDTSPLSGESRCSRLAASSSSGKHASAKLHASSLLSLLLDPSLVDNLTPGAILAADNRALFKLLPLILAAIERVGETTTKRDSFVRLVSYLRKRIVACRGLKLRFLLLIQNPAYASQWTVRMVHRRFCYASARVVLHQLANDQQSLCESFESVAIANELSGPVGVEKKSSRSPVTEMSTSDLASFAVRTLLNPRHGVRARTLLYRLHTVHSAFYGPELVEAIMEHGDISNRIDAVAVAQRLIDIGMIAKASSSSRRFVDDRRRVYQCNFALHRDDDGHCSVQLTNGLQLTSWDEVKECLADKIKHIAVQMPMDMVDLQSLEFWTNSVYVRQVENGYRYGYRAIVHPLYCLGMDPDVEMDFSVINDKANKALDGDLVDPETNNDSNSDGPSSVESQNVLNLQDDGAVVGSAIVRKVFASIARPMIVQLRVPIENADLEEDEHHVVMNPAVLVKEGDNLMQDLGVECMFQCFNHIWECTPSLFKTYNMVPLSVSYEVFPTSSSQGFMEAVTGLVSLKEYDWAAWRDKHGADSDRVKEMLRSTAGAYVGAYVVGGRDRHFDNVLVKDDKHLLHIDFGFLLGTSPPIDGPPIAIAPQMEVVFRELNIWQTFVRLFVDTFMALRAHASEIIRTSVLIFTKAGYEEHQIRQYLQGKMSLNTHVSSSKAAEGVRKQLILSSGDIKTKFKQFAHEHIDPAWYGLLEKGFPPAVAIMKLVDAKEQRAAKKLEESSQSATKINEEELLQVKE